MRFCCITLYSVIILFSAGFTQDIIKNNIKFKDMNGKSYDLFTLLGQRKFVMLENEWND